MRKFAIFLGFVAVVVFVGYQYRLELLMTGVPIVASILDPIGPNQPVQWSQGPQFAEVPPGARPPNIIVILADDMGFNDVSYYNGGAADGGLQTPNIDSIAHAGVAFTNGYAGNAVCAPSRASILSGRYSTRFGFEYTPFFKVGVTIIDWLNAGNSSPLRPLIDHEQADAIPPISDLGMPGSEITMAEMLKSAGYQTAHIGKWHLGSVDGMRAEDQGFDDSLNMSSGLYLPEHSPDVVNAKQEFDALDKMIWTVMRYSAQFNGGAQFEPNGYLTDYYSDEAIKVIEANKHRPFFLYLAHWGIHSPLQAKKQDYDALAHIEDHRLRVYAAMIRALDRGVGRVLDALRDNGLQDNTLVIFTSDNGGAGYLGLPDVNKPYRGWKLTLFEGGTHVPYFARWPAKIEPGTRFEHPVGHIDIFATAAAAARTTLPDDRVIDGVDLMPYVTGQRVEPPHRTLFWRQGYYQVVLHDGWKLMVSEKPDTKWLYNLREDPTEQNNLAAAMSSRVEVLQTLLEEHNQAQAEPRWPSVIQMPVLVDKTGAEDYVDGDEYIYWPN